jgi:hypothetical protein
MARFKSKPITLDEDTTAAGEQPEGKPSQAALPAARKSKRYQRNADMEVRLTAVERSLNLLSIEVGRIEAKITGINSQPDAKTDADRRNMLLRRQLALLWLLTSKAPLAR